MILKELREGKKNTGFWHLLLLLKWNLEYQDYRKPSQKIATRQDTYKLLSQIQDLEKQHPTLDLKKNDGIVQTLTILANQQLPYQDISL